MDTGIQRATHWSGFTGDALKVSELLVKLGYTEKSAKSIFGNSLDSGEKIENLDEDMCKSFSKTTTSPLLTRKKW